jgi:outer membrane protein assembly factor BamA
LSRTRTQPGRPGPTGRKAPATAFQASLFVVLALAFFQPLRAQDTIPPRPPYDSSFVASSPVVDEIVVAGNEKTKAFVILREMSIHPGDTLTKKAIDYDKERIYSLRLFNRVEVTAAPAAPGRAKITVQVNERWYIFPYPILGIRDRDWSKVFYGAGLVHSNFRGRNEKLYASAVLGYDPSYSLWYRNPFLNEEGTWFLEGRTSYSIIRNRSPQVESELGEYQERHFNLLATVGRRFGRQHSAWVNGGYRSVHVPNESPISTISGSGTDKFPVLGAGYTFDSRDLAEYPSRGSLVSVTASKSGFPGHEVDFFRYATDLRYFQPLPGGFTLAGRVYTDFAAGGTVPSYSRVYIGYGERVRGHFRTLIEGENLAGAIAELRFPIVSARYVKVGMLPDGVNLWRLGLSAALFGDAGTAWFRDEKFSTGNLTKGYGAGLNFLLPYSIVLRVEYARNEARKGEVIIDLGTML